MGMRRKYAASAVAAASLLALVGCSGSSEPATSGGAGGSAGGKTEITFMGWGSDTEIATFEAMIDQYEEMYPDVSVNYITVPAADFPTKLQTMIAAGQTPDVFYLIPDYLIQYVDNGLLADMTSYVADNDLFEQSNIWPAALETYSTDGSKTGVGSIYALPKDVGPFALAYNVDMFKAAGIEPATPDSLWTWDDYVDAAQKLTSGEGPAKVYGSAPFSLESAVWSNGSDWISEDLTTVTVTDPAFVEALQWVADLALVEGVAPTAEEEASLGSMQRFVDGNLGMVGIGPWSQGQLWSDASFEWDVMPWPVSPNTGKEAIWYGGIGFAVSAKSPAQEAAMNLAAFLSVNEDAQRTNWQMGQAVPNLIDMARGEFLESDKAPANKAEFLRILDEYGRRNALTSTYDPTWMAPFNSGVAAVYNGDMTAAEFTASVKDEMQKALDEGNAKRNK